MKPIPKLVRVLFLDGSTYTGSFYVVNLSSDLLILAAPGKLISFRVKPVAVNGVPSQHPGIARVFVS